MELRGKTALVTGAASGIGAACAVALAEAGADVVMADIGDASHTASRVVQQGGRCLVQSCDVADYGSIEALFRATDDFTDGLDIVVNSAGVLIENSVVDMAVDDFDRTIAINLRGTFLLGKQALPRLRQSASGRFIAVASELAYPGRADFSAYCASKAGVIGLVRSWAREYAPDVLVNAIAPGPVDTAMLGLESMSRETIERESENPLGRIARPEEIAAAVVFLVGPNASFFTGQTISPNGGAVMF